MSAGKRQRRRERTRMVRVRTKTSRTAQGTVESTSPAKPKSFNRVLKNGGERRRQKRAASNTLETSKATRRLDPEPHLRRRKIKRGKNGCLPKNVKINRGDKEHKTNPGGGPAAFRCCAQTRAKTIHWHLPPRRPPNSCRSAVRRRHGSHEDVGVSRNTDFRRSQDNMRQASKGALAGRA